jgi:hypothetical protein
MFDGWYCLGGTEIINNNRAVGYATTADCPVSWFRGDLLCPGLPDMIGDYGMQYVASDIPEDAPWYDTADLQTYRASRFLGFYCTSVSGLDGATRTASVTERLDDGGVISRTRWQSRQATFEVLLTALSQDSLQFGLEWLSSRLQESSCSVHDGNSCGTSDLTFFTTCWPPYDPNGGYKQYEREVDNVTRILHGVKCTSGPIVTGQFHRGENAWGMTVEFTLTAENPRLLGLPKDPEIRLTGETIATDVPFNLVPYPSAELAGSNVTVATNYSTNPSLETNATGWAASSTVVTPTATGARSTAVASVGTASYAVSCTTTNTSTNGTLVATQTVTLPTYTAGRRFSVTQWMLANKTGTATLTQTRLQVQWLDGSSTLLRTDNIGVGPLNGGVIAQSSILPPANAATAKIIGILDVASWTSGAVLTLYCDASAVTVP